MTRPGADPSDPNVLLELAYRPLITYADAVTEAEGWRPTALPGWTVRDLLFHLAGDAQRALVALNTPSGGPVDTDEISYWSHWSPGTPGAEAGLRGTRIQASAWSSVRGPADLYADTARAVLVAAGRADPAALVTTQGRTLTVAALLHTLSVEAAVHHLDLEPALDADAPGPDAQALAQVRRVVEALLDQSLPAHWGDRRCVLLGTGRAEPTDPERAVLGPAADRLPAFG